MTHLFLSSFESVSCRMDAVRTAAIFCCMLRSALIVSSGVRIGFANFFAGDGHPHLPLGALRGR
jgi:hypothetical protein